MGAQTDQVPEGRMLPECRALIGALRFQHPEDGALRKLSAAEWHSLLDVCDRCQATLLLGRFCEASLPAWVRTRVTQNYVAASQRYERISNSVTEIARALDVRGVKFVLLKGLTYSSDFGPDPILRSQGDIDIWCRPNDIGAARDALIALGYYAVGKSRGRHLSPMIREKHWEWHGNYYAPDLPIPVDLHYCLWDEAAEGITGPDHTAVWSRRKSAQVGGELVLQLDDIDLLGFAALHLLMHLLHGDLRLQRAWEIACFLQNRARDEDLWTRWLTFHSREARIPQVVVFSLLQRWFHCQLPNILESEKDALLSADVALWIERYGFSPVAGLFSPNKDELGLNLHLLESRRAKVRIFWRRLFPLLAANPSNLSARAGHAANGTNIADKVDAVRSRMTYHLRTLPAACLHGMSACRVWRRSNGN